MLIDEVEVKLKAGSGGNGIVSFGKMRKSGPDGGNGGKGGDIYLNTINDIYALNKFSSQPVWEAQSGESGGKNKMTGKNADNLYLEIPCGTTIIDTDSNQTVVEINEVDSTYLIAKGGCGGKGNWEFRSPTNTTPKHAETGEKGEVKNLKFVLKLIADYGLIGLPNSGKSSLLNEITGSRAKIGNYAFTTISPNLGVLEGKIIADIPGLIEGASDGKGLGISFLKHIEKVRVLLHCVSCESVNPKRDYTIVRKELKSYDNNLSDKIEIILLTKSDLVSPQKISEIKKCFKKHNLLPISIYDFYSIQQLVKLLNTIKPD